MTALSLRLPDELEDKLTEEARLEHKSRSEVVREALAEYLTRREKERFMDEFLAEAREALANPDLQREARAIAEDFLPLENEGFDQVEGHQFGESSPDEYSGKWWK